MKLSLFPNIQPWDSKKAVELRKISQQSFRHSYSHTGSDPDNCEFCALSAGGAHGPNHCGWERIYVEAGMPIPHKWMNAFNRTLYFHKNRLYREALQRSVKTFGARFSPKN